MTRYFCHPVTRGRLERVETAGGRLVAWLRRDGPGQDWRLERADTGQVVGRCATLQRCRALLKRSILH